MKAKITGIATPLAIAEESRRILEETAAGSAIKIAELEAAVAEAKELIYRGPKSIPIYCPHCRGALDARPAVEPRIAAIESAYAKAYARVGQLEAALRAFTPEGIEQVCDDCGGDETKCGKGCPIWDARALLTLAETPAKSDLTWQPAGEECSCEIGFCRKQNLSAKEHCRVDRLNYASKIKGEQT